MMRHLVAALVLTAALTAAAACDKPAPPAAAPAAALDSVVGTAFVPLESGTLQVDVPSNVVALAAYEHGVYRYDGVAARYVAPDSTVKLRTRAYVKNWRAGDSLVFTYHKGPWASTGTQLQLLAPVDTNRSVNTLDSAFVAAPAYADSAAYLGCAQIKHGKDASLTPLGCWPSPWKYVRPDLTPSTIDSVRRIDLRGKPLVPGGPYTLAAGQAPTEANQVQWCPFAELASGRRVKMENAWNNPTCDSLYQSWLAERQV